MTGPRIDLDELRDDVAALAAAHRRWAAEHSPPQDVHAVVPEALAAPGTRLLTARDHGGALLGMAALRELDPGHGELKAMHVRAEARGTGLGRALLVAVLDLAGSLGQRRVSLETGTMEAFAGARRLYASLGFVPCPPFGSYGESPNSVCMTLALPDRG